MQQAAMDACSFVEGLAEVVWDTVQLALPELLEQLPSVRRDAESVIRRSG